MSKEKEEVTKEPSKFDKLKEMWKDKRGRAKIKLCLYLIFFVGVVIFARVLGYQNSKLPHNDNANNNSFIYTLKDKVKGPIRLQYFENDNYLAVFYPEYSNTGTQLFQGVIKNKSELIRLLKQLEING